MKTSLQLQIGQQLTLTPQLQQAIRLLQLSTLELQQEIQQNLDANPMLEVNEETNETSAENDEILSESSLDQSLNLQNENLPKDLPVDSVWEDIYPSNASPRNNDYSDDSTSFESWTSCHVTLQSHLLWQKELTLFSPRDQVIATAIIDSINENGFLTCSTDEILQTLRTAENDLELDEVEAVLHRIQCFDPPGVGARNLRESLLIQLRQIAPTVPMRNLAMEIVKRGMALLAARDYAQIIRTYKLTQDQLTEILKLIQSMNPRPGSQIASKLPEYIIPDVIIHKVKNRWQVELNAENIPKLKINSNYASLIKRGNNTDDNKYLRSNLQEARWFIKSLQSRNETLLKVATRIVEHQQGFLEYGDEAMKPLILHSIADSLGMHESTISRVTTHKYMHTPRGIYELKYFFSSHVGTETGGECSSTAIRAIIKKIIAAENPKKPLSDNKIATILKKEGINVARRTIAKYRESIGIAPSNERRALF